MMRYLSYADFQVACSPYMGLRGIKEGLSYQEMVHAGALTDAGRTHGMFVYIKCWRLLSRLDGSQYLLDWMYEWDSWKEWTS